MRKPKSAGSLATLLFAALAILPAGAADLTTESIEALRQRLPRGEAAAVDAEARRRLEAADRGDDAGPTDAAVAAWRTALADAATTMH
jgi:hypothetical protein